MQETTNGKNWERCFSRAVVEIVSNAQQYSHKKPTFSTLLEEFAELVLSLRGKHDDPPELEITQIGGICMNLLAQIHNGGLSHINNIGPNRLHESESGIGRKQPELEAYLARLDDSTAEAEQDRENEIDPTPYEPVRF